MKKWIRSAAQTAVLGMALGTYTQIAYADTGTPSRVSGEFNRPATLVEIDEASDILEVLYMRFHTVNIQNHISEMKRDGVTTREYVAAFDLQGALVYDHELAGLGLKPANLRSGRNAGIQVLPYEVQIGTDGRTYVKASAVAFRNMTSALLNCEEYGEHLAYNCEREFKEGDYTDSYKPNPWLGLINNLDLFIFEYDKDIARQITTHSLDVVQVDLDISLFATASGNFFIAVTVGGAMGFDWLQANDFHPHQSDFEGIVDVGSAFGYKVKYGLVAHYDSGLWRLNTGVNFSVDYRTYNNPSSNSENFGFSRLEHIARPFIETSIQMQNSEDGLPIRLGVRVDGTFRLDDKIEEFRNKHVVPQDFRERGNDSLVNGSLFISW